MIDMVTGKCDCENALLVQAETSLSHPIPFANLAVRDTRSGAVHARHTANADGIGTLRLLEAMMDDDPALAGMRHAVVSSWYWRRGYLDAMADLIANEARSCGMEVRAEDLDHRSELQHDLVRPPVYRAVLADDRFLSAPAHEFTPSFG